MTRSRLSLPLPKKLLPVREWPLVGLTFGLALTVFQFSAPFAEADTSATCGIAAGEAITAHDIEIHCGLNIDQIKELFRTDSSAVTALVEVSKKLGVKELAIKGFLETIKKAEVPDEELAGTFAAIAKDYLSLLNDRQAVTTGGAAAQDLLRQADAAIEEGQVETAKPLLARVAVLREVQRKRREQLRQELDKADLDDAAVDARSANISLTQLDYAGAAKLFRQASEKVPTNNWQERGNFLVQSGDALMTLGHQKGKEADLERSVSTYRQALTDLLRQRAPLDWAKAQNKLGHALWHLADHDNGTARLEQAVAAFNAALEELPRTRLPLDWALTQNNLGLALWSQGDREAGTARLDQAVTAFRAALEEQPRKQVPLDWAETQNDLGLALWTLGERQNDPALLEDAITAFRLAMEEQPRELAPLAWALSQNNLGNALTSSGLREAGTQRLDEAVKSFRLALEVRTRARVPLEWALTQNNLGYALQLLGERQEGTARLEEAVAVFREALEEQTRERVPLDWARTQSNLGVALVTIGFRQPSESQFQEAKSVIQSAWDAYRAAGVSRYDANFSTTIAQIDAELAKLKTNSTQ